MAGGLVIADVGGRAAQYNAKVTWYVVLVALIASSGGLLFGYDLGVTGGVTAMPDFLRLFFPSVAAHVDNNTDPYCSYDDQRLQSFTSSLFISGAVFALVASFVNKRHGRKLTMMLGGGAFCIGAILCAFAQDLAMLVVGRVCLGAGVGFANQAVPLYLSEIAPPHVRGSLNIMFQMATTIGIWVAQWINYGTQNMHPHGWRLSVGLAIVPASILLLGSLVVPDTPNSLAHRGYPDQAKKVLQRVRGVEDVDAEFADILEACDISRALAGKWRVIFSKKYRPVLTGSILIPFFQQFTGINTIMFYASQLFVVLGAGQNAALLNTAIIGAVNVGSTVVGIVLVDRVGRKALFLEGGIQMFICFVVVAAVMGASFNKTTGYIANGPAAAILAFECLFTAGFAWSWGPLGWLVPSEFHNIETRSIGQGITTSVNFIFSFVIGQCYLSMLCKMEYGTYIFFAFWVFVMTCYVMFFLPELKGVPIEEVGFAWRRHWFWSRVIMTPEQRVAFRKGDLVGAGMGATELSGGHPIVSSVPDPKLGAVPAPDPKLAATTNA